jgi:flagellar biosynthesis/type III secretory pathway protein FliH
LQLNVYQDLVNKSVAKGIQLTPEQDAVLVKLSVSIARATQSAKDAKANFEFAKGATLGFIQTLRQGLVNGEKFWKSFGNAALSVLNKIIDKIEKQLVDALFSLGSAGSVAEVVFSGRCFVGLLAPLAVAVAVALRQPRL